MSRKRKIGIALLVLLLVPIFLLFIPATGFYILIIKGVLYSIFTDIGQIVGWIAVTAYIGAFGLAIRLIRSGRRMNLGAEYNKAIELAPDNADAYYKRGLAYHEKGEVVKAVSDLEKCIGLSTDPELTEAAQQALSEIRNSP